MDRHTIIPLFEKSDNEEAKEYLRTHLPARSVQNIDKQYGSNCWYMANYSKIYFYMIDNVIPTLCTHFEIRKRYIRVFRYNFIELSLQTCRMLGLCQEEIEEYFGSSVTFFKGKPEDFYPDTSMDWSTIQEPEPDRDNMIDNMLHYPLHHFTNILLELKFSKDDIPLIDEICTTSNLISRSIDAEHMRSTITPILNEGKKVAMTIKLFPLLDINGIHQFVDLLLRHI